MEQKKNSSNCNGNGNSSDQKNPNPDLNSTKTKNSDQVEKKSSNDVVDTKSFNKADQKNVSSEGKEIEKDPSRSANGTC